MALNFRCETRGNGSGGSLGPLLTGWTNSGFNGPGTVPAAGDLVVLVGAYAASSQTVTQTAGTGTWSIQSVNDNPGGTLTTFVAYRVFDGTETAPTFTPSIGSCRFAFSVVAVAPDPGFTVVIDTWGATVVDTTAATAHTPGVLNSANTGTSLIFAGAQTSTNGTNSVSFTAPSGWQLPLFADESNDGTASTAGYGAAAIYQPLLTGTITPGAETIQGGATAGGTTVANLYHLLIIEVDPAARVNQQQVAIGGRWS